MCTRPLLYGKNENDTGLLTIEAPGSQNIYLFVQTVLRFVFYFFCLYKFLHKFIIIEILDTVEKD